jgi:4-hydroxybenzoate polyprenyltransferase
MNRAGMTASLRDFGSLVKLSHSVFALPFALLSLLVATRGAPSWRLLGLVVVAVVAARTAAMAYNRWADRELDAANPRTKNRELPSGRLRPGGALALAAASSVLFLCACWLLGPVCFWLGGPVLVWLLLYSHTKRFTVLCHLWLGIALGLSPVAAWVAAKGSLTDLTAPLCLSAGVTLWVAGFDILYACQDESFDRAHGLKSLPAALGQAPSMEISSGCHVLAVLLFAAFGVLVNFGVPWFLGVGAAATLLVYQHRIVRPGRLERMQAAFFTANGCISVLMFAVGCIDLYFNFFRSLF